MKQIKIYPMKPDYKPTEGRKYVGGVYLHGKASDITKWDLFEVSISTLEEFKEMEDGIYDVIIVFLPFHTWMACVTFTKRVFCVLGKFLN